MASYGGHDLISPCVRGKWARPAHVLSLHHGDVQQHLRDLMLRSRTGNATHKRKSWAQGDQRPNPNTLACYQTALNPWVGFVYSQGMHDEWLRVGERRMPALDLVADTSGDFLLALYRFVATGRYAGAEFEASIDTCAT